MILRRFSTLLMISVSSISIAYGQETSEGDATVLKAITVTAQHREQAAKDVPVSMRVFTQNDLEKRIARRLEDAFAATANVSLTNQRGGNDATSLSIRGVATSAFAADPTVGVYVDDIYIGTDGGFNSRMGDLQQVEILRGPQGTLYGRNAIGGAVSVKTASPELGVNSATIESGFGSDGLVFGSATANVAIGEDAAARLTVFGERSDGWLENAQGGPNFMNADSYGGRGKFLFSPSDDWDLELSVDFVKDNGRKAGFGPYATVWDNGVDQAIPYLDWTENYGVSLKSTWQLDVGELVSITGWRGSEAWGDGGQFTSYRYMLGGYTRDYDQFTQEVRLTSEGDRFDFVTGAYLFGSREKRHEYGGYYDGLPADSFYIGQPALPAGYTEGSHAGIHSLTAALFGDLTWHATDKLDLIAGARVSYDRKSIDYEHASTLGAFGLLAPAQILNPSLNGFDFSPRIGLTYELSEEAKVYAMISRGYKPAGFNISFAPNSDLGFEPESAINYEVGMKGDLLDGKLGYSLSAFYFDWKNQQVYTFVNNQVFIGNASKSRSVGLEAEISAEITDGLNLYAGAGILDARLTEHPNAASGEDESGNQQPFASKYSTNLSLEYMREVMDDMRFVARADYNWRSHFYWDTTNRLKEPGYGIVNVRLGVEKDDWSVSVFAQNLFDQKYHVRAETYAGELMGLPGTPRTFGVMAKAKF